jgi:hypothetical protein
VWDAGNLSSFDDRATGGASVCGDSARAVANVSCLNDEDDVFGDVCGMVSDALEVSRYGNEVETRFDRPPIAEHVGE